MTSAQSREESLNRLESLLSGMGPVMPAVHKAIEEGRIDPSRFDLSAKDIGPRLEGIRKSGAENAGGGRGSNGIRNPLGMEAIVRRVGRPPMLIRDDKVVFEPVSLLPELTEARVRRIESLIPSVGRIEFINHSQRWGGTGFVVDGAPKGRRRVVTNRHVAKIVAKRRSTGAGVFMRSAIGARYGAKLDMREEVDSDNNANFELLVTDIVYLADDTESDVALLEIETRDGLAPDPLDLAGRRAKNRELVATVGYPAYDDRNGVAEMHKYFNDLYEVKRFAPGLIMSDGAGTILSHDCTTLGGNSGSCLLSIEQENVVGLHFSGEFGVANAAVSVETLKDLLSGSLMPAASIAAEATLEARRDGEHRPDELEGREGYDPSFLDRDLPLPWPEFGRDIADDLAPPTDAEDERKYELRYTNFGVLFSQSRRGPRVTAVNIDGEASVRIKRGDDQWFFDLRIPRELQLGQDAYADKEIDRGHMVRREDPNWGEAARQANDDTFHYTNAALQHSSLNQGRTLWQGLEHYILESARTEGFKACVFTGPIFRDDDPELPPSNAQVPQEFWKIVVMLAEGGGLHATGYVLSQGDLIRDLLERRGRDEAVEGFVLGPYRTFQVAIAHIEEVTGLSFPALRGADPLARGSGGEEALSDGRPIYLPLESVEDVVLGGPQLREETPAGEPPDEEAALRDIGSRLAAIERRAGTAASPRRNEGADPSLPLLQRLVAAQETVDEDEVSRSEELSRLFQDYHAAIASKRTTEEIAAPDFAKLKDEYQSLFDTCTIRDERKSAVAWHVKKLEDFRPRYEKVGAQLEIPWWFVGVTHALEATFNFKGHLHNGDPLTRRTVQVPKNRPPKWNPPNDWESSAVDALTMKGYAGQDDWSVPRALYRFERFNGWGYRSRSVNTPYLWSFSHHYTKGKFVKDGVYSASAVSKQCGAAVMLKALGI